MTREARAAGSAGRGAGGRIVPSRPWPGGLLLSLAPVILAACASGGGGEPAGPDVRAGDGWVRQLAPFAVRGATDSLYSHPFLGGLDVPRPQLIDIDEDGDLDLFLQERSGAVMFFENTGSLGAPVFTWRTDWYQDLAVGEWNRFVDLDGDGDYDLLAEQPFSYIRHYENVGTPARAEFRLAADSLRDPDGEPIFSDRQNIPSVADVDCDGLLDLFLGRVEGTVTRYEETGPADPFRLVARRFEDIEIVAQIGLPPSLHGANSMFFADYDGDGDLDLFWGDFFEPGLLLIRNTGSCESPNFRGEPVPVPAVDSLATSGYNAPYLADFDGDGDLDLFIGVLGGAFNPNRTAADNLYYLEADDGRFRLVDRRFIDGIDVGSESLPALADYDGDGDLDLFIANKVDPGHLQAARVYRFENTGSPTRPAFRLADTLALSDAYHQAPAFGDLDGDGDLDMLLGTWNDGIALFRNRGTAREPRMELEDPAYIQLTRGSNTTPALADIDGDGDLDLLVGESSGRLNFYRNEGTPREPRFELVSDEYLDIDVGRRSAPALVDVDGDGDLDLVLGREDGPLLLYRNRGTAREPRFVLDEDAALAALPLQAFSTPAFGDIDGDGELDLVAGGLSGGLVYYERRDR